MRTSISGCRSWNCCRRGTSHCTAKPGVQVMQIERGTRPGGQLLGRGRDLVERGADGGEVGAALGVRLHLAGTPLQQGKADPLLQILDLLADGARGDVQLMGRALHAAQAGAGLEGAQGVERRQVPFHGLENLTLCVRASRLMRPTINATTGTSALQDQGYLMLPIADRWFEIRRVSDDITLLWEPHVVPLMRCNIWHVRGRDRDLMIDTGMGIASLRDSRPAPARQAGDGGRHPYPHRPCRQPS